jgi:hypothetical protein
MSTSLPPAARETMPLRPPEPPAAAPPPICLNCGAALHGHFCSDCGQRDVPPYPSVRELAVDAFWELSGWDGRFASTARALIARPGKLTREFLEGRRARYISPLRLYLMCSLVYFLLAAAAPNATGGGLRVSSSVPSTATAADRVGSAAESAMRSDAPLDEARRAKTLADIQRAPVILRPFLRRVVLDPAGFKRGVRDALPRMLFALLPVFALIVALFYRGRKYPEHLYFAIHLHAFTFLSLAVMELVKFTRVPGLVATVAFVAFLSIPVYATLAFRNAYGGSLVRTLTKEVGIGAIYGLTSVAAFATMVYIVSVAG